ncbi:MAG: hypothetical protein LBH22_01035, partial [Bacteroidales bacterium]|nr:hypothetical protein [Bacteroidales bacterium]
IFYDYRRLKKAVDRGYTTPHNNHLERVRASGTNWRYIYQIPQIELNNNPLITDADNNPFEGDAIF